MSYIHAYVHLSRLQLFVHFPVFLPHVYFSFVVDFFVNYHLLC